MNKSYTLYLLIVVFILALFLTLYYFSANRRGKRSKGTSSDIDIVSCGSLSIFFDNTGNATLIPYVKDLYGHGRAITEVQFLKGPFDEIQLGKMIRYSMGLCNRGIPCSNSELMRKLGHSSWEDFSRGKRNVSVYYWKGAGIIFNTTRRKTDGSYEFNSTKAEAVLDAAERDASLGRVALQMLKRCRC